MIFYGTNSSKIKKGQLRNITCPNCSNDVSMNYTVFGEVVSGMEVVDKIAAVATNKSIGDRPVEDVRMRIKMVK